MKISCCALAAAMLLVPALAHASDGTNDSLLRTAEVLAKGESRILAAVSVSLENHGANALVLGYGAGLTPKLDFQGKLSVDSDTTSFGGGVNYWAMKRGANPVDLSLGAGLSHMTFSGGNVTSLDIAIVISKPVNPQLKFYGGLALGLGSIGGSQGATLNARGGDTSFTSTHLVPGIEYKVNDRVNFLAELGIGASDGGNYLAGGIHYYIKK